MKRPFTVTTLLWMVLTLVAWNAVRAFAAINDWTVLQEFAPRPGPIYTLISGSFWTVSGFAVWLALRQQRRDSARKSLLYLMAYILWWWADRLYFSGAGVNLFFDLFLTLLFSIPAVAFTFHPRTQDFLTQRETHDHNSPD